MTAYTYSCADFEGMEDCPGRMTAETEEELLKLVELHALLAHGEDASQWDDETRAQLESLIKKS